MTDQQPPTIRLDIWLWAARFFKTRALAKHAIETGKVSVDGERPKPSRVVRAGANLKIERGVEVFDITVKAVSDTRGPAPVAQLLYEESEASIEARRVARQTAAAARAGYLPPETKPDKRARRLIRALGDLDAL
jgi:ribosome-associated heat shock protein Hsp15